jgi:hypothetical protein
MKNLFNGFFVFMIVFGAFLSLGGVLKWKDEFSAKGSIPVAIVLGSAFLLIGIFHFRKSWIFRPPMKSSDMKLFVDGEEYKTNKRG